MIVVVFSNGCSDLEFTDAHDLCQSQMSTQNNQCIVGLFRVVPLNQPMIFINRETAAGNDPQASDQGDKRLKETTHNRLFVNDSK